MRPLGAWTGVAAGALRGSSLFRHYVAMKSLHNASLVAAFQLSKDLCICDFFCFCYRTGGHDRLWALKRNLFSGCNVFVKRLNVASIWFGEVRVCRPKLYVMRSMSFFFFYPLLSPFLRTPLTRHPAPFFLAYLFGGSFQCISGSYSFYIASLSVPYRISGILLFFGSRRLFHALYPVVRRFVETRNPGANREQTICHFLTLFQLH